MAGQLLSALAAADIEQVKEMATRQNIEDTKGDGLCVAAADGHEGFVRLLILRGATPDTISASYDCPAIVAAAAAGHADCVKALLDLGADVNIASARTTRPLSWYDGGTTALMGGVEVGSVDVVLMLLQSGADVMAKDVNGATALWRAAVKGRTQMMELLVQRGAHARTTLLVDDEDEHEGGGQNDAEQQGANHENRPRVEMPPLIMAIVSGLGINVMEALLDASAEVEARDSKTKGTALMWAARLGRDDIARLLVARGASPHAKDKDGKTAADVSLTTELRASLREMMGRPPPA